MDRKQQPRTYDKFREQKFASVKKYEDLKAKCHNCKNGRVTGGAKKDEAKRIGTCGYCSGSAIKNKEPIEVEI